MKGKRKEKRKVGKVILVGLGFFLTIILTFTTTLAWFYDADWANNYVSMAGTVGIEIRRRPTDAELDLVGTTGEDGTVYDQAWLDNKIRSSGSNNLYFKINGTEKAYPGQAIDCSATVYNNGGDSGANGSDCYIRAHFAVYTNIGTNEPDPNDYETTDYPDGTTNPEYISDLAEIEMIRDLIGSESLYAFLDNVISTQNALAPTSGYYWQYYQHQGTIPLSTSGISTEDLEYYIDGTSNKTVVDGKDTPTPNATVEDKGYFYLCEYDEDNGGATGILKRLGVGDTAIYLWDSAFIIPWQLTNLTADRYIFVTLTFQAIQTYIPQMVLDDGESTGVIWTPTTETNNNLGLGNQIPYSQCTYNSPHVQTVFNTCKFGDINTKAMVNGEEIDFSTGEYVGWSEPSADSDNRNPSFS